MAASDNRKPQCQTQAPKTKRRKRRETTITASADASLPLPPTQQSSPPSDQACRRKRQPPAVVSLESAWCCSTTSTASALAKNPSPSTRRKQQKQRAAIATPEKQPTAEKKAAKEAEPLSVIFAVRSPSQSPFTIRVSPGRVSSPLMDAYSSSPAASGGACAFTSHPPSYNKFNTALTAGLLNPMSPPPPTPLDKARSSPTLFDMMANEPDYIPRHPIPATANSSTTSAAGKSTASVHDRQAMLQQRAAEISGGCSPGNEFNDPSSSDVKLKLSSRDGLSLSVSAHLEILFAHSRFFAAKLSPPPPDGVVEIADCDDVAIFLETLRLMYCKDLRKKLMREDVSKVLSILQVSAAIEFDAGILSCLEHLEAAPWAEDEEEKIASLLSQLHLDGSRASDVLRRVSIEAEPSMMQGEGPPSKGEEDILSRLLQVVLQGKDERARRDMKALVSKMLRENSSSQAGLAKETETLYSACRGCLQALRSCFLLAVDRGCDAVAASQIARQADNLYWMADILINRCIANEFVRAWADEAELAEAHPRVAAVHRHEVSRVSARLFVGIGKGQVLVSSEERCGLLIRWLQPFYEDFGWMRRSWKGMDRHLIEEGLSGAVLTLPIAWQQKILMEWFDRFLNSGEDCPNLQRAFEGWWRRAFWRRSVEVRFSGAITAADENQI